MHYVNVPYVDFVRDKGGCSSLSRFFYVYLFSIFSTYPGVL